MESKDLILVEKKDVYLEKRRRGITFKKLILRFFLLLLVTFLAVTIIWAFPKFKEFYRSGALEGFFGQGITDKNPSTPSTDTGASIAPPSDEAGKTPETSDKEKIPNGAYEIKEVKKDYTVTNEAEISLELEESRYSSIEEIRKKYGKDAPIILITHIFPKESYSNGKYYTTEDNFYSETENVGALAKELSKKLNELGLKTVYLEGEYAKGSVYGALSEYETALKNTLSTYPSISYVFSISRGIYVNEDMTLERETVTYNGEKCAQIRIVSGTNGEKTSEAQKKSLSFALDFAKFLNENLNNFVCESKVSRFPLGQNVSALTLEIELGTYASTFDESQNSTELVSQLILEYFSTEKNAS